MISNSEILLMADVVSREKGLEKDVIFEAIEAALATATRKRHREDIEARVNIQRTTGDYDTFRQWLVIEDDEDVEFPSRQINLQDAREKSAEIEVGQFIEEQAEKNPLVTPHSMWEWIATRCNFAKGAKVLEKMYRTLVDEKADHVLRA